MAKIKQSFWDFGDVSKPSVQPSSKAAEEKPYSVKELTERIKNVLESGFSSILVSGEISNLRIQSSGHSYFVLKDDASQLQCVIFRSAAQESRSVLADGLKVVARGEITVYSPRGQYQLVVRTITPSGLGDLQLAFERLKKKLRDEGLFEQARKRRVPELPENIGLVTSPTGAAIQDVLHVLQRRHPGIRIHFVPCRVQGDGAAAEVAQAIRLLCEWSDLQTQGEKLDAILITRGGGSLEDLWAFNEESVARAIHQSTVPVISAVGHEIDFTIADFTADLRAATPSAAAEMLSQGAVTARETILNSAHRLNRAMQNQFERVSSQLQDLQQRLQRTHPRRRLENAAQKIDELFPRLRRSVSLKLKDNTGVFGSLCLRMTRTNPASRVQEARQLVERLASELRDEAQGRMEQERNSVRTLGEKLELLAPHRVLKRGYSITLKSGSQKVVRSAAEVSAEDVMVTILSEGRLVSVVTTTRLELDVTDSDRGQADAECFLTP